MLKPIGAKAVQRSAREKEGSRHAKFAQRGQRMLDMTRQVVIECDSDRRASPVLTSRCVPIVIREGVKRNKFNDISERLQMVSEHVRRYRRNNRAVRSERLSQAVVDQNEAMSADAGEREQRGFYRR
jgi:hypothetical protein